MATKPPVLRRTPAPEAPEPAPQDDAPPASAAAPAPAVPTARPQEIGGGLAALDAIAHGALDMAALMASSTPGRNRLQPGDAVKGVVVRVTNDGVHVELGARSEGWIALRDAPTLKIGDAFTAYVVEVDENGVQLSTRLSGESAAAHLEEALESGIPVEAVVQSRSGGGYSVKVGPVRAFLPISHASRLPVAQPDALIGQTISVAVLEVGEKVVVSRRVLEEKQIEEARRARLPTLLAGAVVDATITSVQSWAVFLDIDGVELMMSRREATWEDVSDLTTVYERGQNLLVRVLGSGDKDRILVSAKDPDLDPWVARLDQLRTGATFRGRVVSVTDFGVFVEVMPGVQGLVHRSRLNKLPGPSEGLDVVVRSVDAERRRLDLGATDPAYHKEDTKAAEAAAAAADEGAWRQAYSGQKKSTGGTLGDLFGALKR